MKIKESDKKKIYYDLRNNNVQVKKYTTSTEYTFGRYKVEDYVTYVVIRQMYPHYKKIVDWNNHEYQQDAYDIGVAVRFKAAGTAYDDPYKDRTANDEIRDLTKEFGKNLLKTADEFLPVDMPKYKALRTIANLRQQFNQQLKEYYTK